MDDFRVRRLNRELYEKYPSPEDRTREIWDEYYRQIQPIVSEYSKLNFDNATKMAAEFIEKNTGGYLYLFTYSDEDGQLTSDMEHGDIFRKLSHLALSHH